MGFRIGMIGSAIIAVPLIFRVIAAFAWEGDPIIQFMTSPILVMSCFILGGFFFIVRYIVRPIAFSFLFICLVIVSAAITMTVYI